MRVATKLVAEELVVSLTTAGSEFLLFRDLLQKTVPLLRNPNSYSESERFVLLQSVRSALEGTEDDEKLDCTEETQK